MVVVLVLLSLKVKVNLEACISIWSQLVGSKESFRVENSIKVGVGTPAVVDWEVTVNLYFVSLIIMAWRITLVNMFGFVWKASSSC